MGGFIDTRISLGGCVTLKTKSIRTPNKEYTCTCKDCKITFISYRKDKLCKTCGARSRQYARIQKPKTIEIDGKKYWADGEMDPHIHPEAFYGYIFIDNLTHEEIYRDYGVKFRPEFMCEVAERFANSYEGKQYINAVRARKEELPYRNLNSFRISGKRNSLARKQK